MHHRHTPGRRAGQVERAGFLPCSPHAPGPPAQQHSCSLIKILCLGWTPGLHHEVGVVLVSWKTSSVFRVERLKAYERKKAVVHGFLPWRGAHCYKNSTKIPKHRVLFSPAWWLRMVSWAHSSWDGTCRKVVPVHLSDGVQRLMPDTLGFESSVCRTDQCHPGHITELSEP